MSGIVEFSFHKCNEYFVKRWKLAQRNIAEQGHFGKAGAEHLKEAEEFCIIVYSFYIYFVFMH